jgi:hypothetical protein
MRISCRGQNKVTMIKRYVMNIVTLENLIYILPALYTDPLRSNISHFYAIYHLYVCTVYSPCKFCYRG